MRFFAGKAANGAMVLAIGQAVGYIASFARNLILARHIAKADYGLAAAFALSVAMLELVGRMSLGQQIVQAKDGDSEHFQGNAHAFQIAAGVISSLLLLLASGFLARALNVPNQAWAFAMLSIVPLCMAIEHLDTHRFRRQFNFIPGVLCESLPQVIMTLVTWPLVLWLGDFRVILWLMIGKSIISVWLSHFLAGRKYRLNVDRVVFLRIVSFSWPMVMNGLFLFLSQQADQFVVGAKYSLEELAMYSVPISILMVPWVFFARVLGPVMLSVLSSVQDSRLQFESNYRFCLELSAISTVFVTLPLIVSGSQITVLLFGAKYNGVGTLTAILAVASAFRFLRSTPSVAALALGDTKNQMLANLSRSASIILVAIAVLAGGGINWVAGCSVIGEAVALIITFFLMSARQGISPWIGAKSISFTMICLLLSIGLFSLGSPIWQASTAILTSVVAALTFAAAAWWTFPQSRSRIICQLRSRSIAS